MMKTRKRNHFLSLQSRGLVCGDFVKKIGNAGGWVRNNFPGVVYLDGEASWSMFEARVRERTGLSGLEWLAANEEGSLDLDCCGPNYFIRSFILPFVKYKAEEIK
jgi:hypothetical protein